MKLRTSFFDKTVLKKDLMRFAPVWVVYIIIGMLIQSMSLGTYYFRVSKDLASAIGNFMATVNCGYGAVVALLLFGDLFNSRLCNALHAMPLRRETWFCSHFAAGLLFALIPNGVLTLIYMVMTKSLWFTALIWLLGAMLSYLFFFGAGTLAVMLAGSRLGSLTAYGLINFVAMELIWLGEELLIPMLRGVRCNWTGLMRLSPMAALMDSNAEYFLLRHDCGDDCRYLLGGSGYSASCAYVFDGFVDGWGYLALIAAAGLIFGAVALWLYRRRQLECAGDFVAFKPVGWVVTVCGSIACGMLFWAFGGDDVSAFFSLFVGIAVGFFLLQMLLQRRTKVLGKKNWLRLGALLLTFALVLGMTALDIFGIEKRIPKAGRVEKVLLADGYLSDYQLSRLEKTGYYHQQYVILTDPGDIDTVRAAHGLILEELDQQVPWHNVTLCYYLKDGTTVLRTYRANSGGQGFRMLAPYFNAEYIFGAVEPEEIIKGLQRLWVNGEKIPVTAAQELVRLMWKDAQLGFLLQDDHDHPEQDSCGIDLEWMGPSGQNGRYLTVWSDAPNTWSYLEKLEKDGLLKLWSEK